MPLHSLDDVGPASDGSASTPAWVRADDLDGPLCALAVYLSVAERQLKAPEIDRDAAGQALRGAGEQVVALAQAVAAACEGPQLDRRRAHGPKG